MDAREAEVANCRGSVRPISDRSIGLLLCAMMAGCVGPAALSSTRTRYNEAFRATNDEQLLLNIVRLRYADSPVFIDLPNITSQFEFAGGGSYAYGLDGSGPGFSNLGSGQLSVRDTPTLSYHPRGGQEIAKALLTPLSTELVSAMSLGATTEQFFLVAVNDVNDVANASRATVMMPEIPDDNAQFRLGVQMLAALQNRGAVELTISETDEAQGSDAVPVPALLPKDLLEAARSGYVFRLREDAHVVLRKREAGLVLRVKPEAVNSPEMQELSRIFGIRPGLDAYKINSELTAGPERDASAPDAGDTLYLNMRSILQIATYLSKGVCVPEEHVLGGIVPMTPGPDGQLYDWTRLTEGLFRVCVQKRKPRHAEVAVCYRGHWFYISENDVNSRAVLAIFELLFAVQESEGRPQGPLLTLPVGG